MSWNCLDVTKNCAFFQDGSDEEDGHVFLEPSAPVKFEAEEAADINDPRLRRLRAARTNVEDRHAGSDEDAEDDRMSRHRRIHEPEVLSDGEEDEDDDKEAEDDDAQMDSDGGSSSGMEDFLKVDWLGFYFSEAHRKPNLSSLR